MDIKVAFGRPERHERFRSAGKPRLRGRQSAKILFTVPSLQTINDEVELAIGEPKGSGESPGPVAWLELKSFMLASEGLSRVATCRTRPPYLYHCLPGSLGAPPHQPRTCQLYRGEVNPSEPLGGDLSG